MKRAVHPGRGFTLLEVMIASAIGVIVLGVGLVVGMQMQRRALFEEQTMLAQVTGRAVKDLLVGDVQRAGLGVGNLPIQFGNADRRFAVQTWKEPNMLAAVGPFPADATFALPPAGPYVNMKSDVLQLFWGDPRAMATMVSCAGASGPLRAGNDFCTGSAPVAGLTPAAGQSIQTIIADPLLGAVGCALRVTGVNAAMVPPRLVGTPGTSAGNITTGDCSTAGAPFWNVSFSSPPTAWVAMRMMGAAYRVNWAGNIPTLEYLAPDSAVWVPVSRDVERIKIRAAVIDLVTPNLPYRWFPNTEAGNVRPYIEQCTNGGANPCTVDIPPGTPAIVNDDDLRSRLWQRVRELEITLVIRTRRSDETTASPNPAAVDEENFPRDGFKRRTFTFRVAPRNFGSAGLQPQGS
ncbi:prepilin-type N-terminal cleavage/methylation domain-containing protein [Myxococcus sp. K15C18031901]|uniref:PilW family protein n=1 Tax=Myxococcus dinghuensis TaxID=2906761 RepID=UPI0020A79687|nr:prepilin-type N-terminal cleavage/methylation domain-containing protein [Myxococcus dinghuensis]MCP3099037.1 prepilin-type N-terminal cleavage/methylation domain-containing protein [Myxococcus dinghuensis]